MSEPLERAEVSAKRLGRILTSQMPEGWGYALVMFSNDGESGLTFVSNCEREGMIKGLKWFLQQVEQGNVEET